MFVKIAFADRVDVLLERSRPERPAARFNRTGRDALYLSVDEASARVAMTRHARAGDPPRVLVRYAIGACRVVDLGHPEARALRERAAGDWRAALARGEEPESWRVVDELGRAGEVGLIDPSRRRPGLWHLTLLRWNEPGAPAVERVGDPVPIILEP